MEIAVIGTGLMGEPLARRLLEAGHRVTVWNRSPEKTRALSREGAVVANYPHEAIQAGEWLLTMVANADALGEVLLNNRSRAALAGRKIVNMATIGPHEARELRDKVAQAGGELMECPVLGSVPEARSGELILMFGGTGEQLADARPLLEHFGGTLHHVGPLGQATALKLALNQLIAGLTTSFAVSLGLAEQEGLDTDQLMEVLRESALYAPTFDKKLGRMRARRYTDPNFPLAHLLKDVGLLEDAARRDGLDTRPLLTMARVLEEADDQGLGEADYSALYDVINPQRP